MAKFTELVRGFRTNVRDGIPSVLHYDGRFVRLVCSSNINGYVGLTTRQSKYSPCFKEDGCKTCPYQKNLVPSIEPNCELALFKPVKI